MPLVSVIIVNYNGQGYIEPCIESVLNQSFEDFEIIVVDNNSEDKSKIFLESLNEKKIKVVFLDKNYGFGYANNVGFRKSSGKFIVILNNDAEVDRDFLKEIVKPFNIDAKIGMVAPLILLKNSPDTIDKAGGHLLYPDGINRGRGCMEKLSKKYLVDGYVLIPDGCAACFKRSVIDECGFFDEDFFLYGEDTDLGLRYLRAGYRCYYTHKAIVYHNHSAISGLYSSMKAFYVERNRVFVLIKNFPFLCLVFSPVFTFVRYFFQAVSVFLKKGSAGEFAREHSSFALLKILISANVDALFSIRKFLKKRKENRSLFKMGGFEFCRFLKAFFLSPVELAFKR